MTPPLTVRNLTSTPIKVVRIERFELPGSDKSSAITEKVGGFLGNITNNVTSIVESTTKLNISSPVSVKLDENAKSFAHDDVAVKVEPFRANTTDIKAFDRSNREILRVTIEAEDQRYRIDTPSLRNASQTFTALDGKAKHHYTGVFIEETTILAMFSSADLDSWMRALKDETPISALSIPGTHNSPTCHRALPSVRCQAVSPREQLDNGVRFFDVRVQLEAPQDPKRDGLVLVHSVFPISLTGTKYFRDLEREVQDFLKRNPSETVIISLKREGTGDGTDQQLSTVLHDHYASNKSLWFTEPRIPRLSDCRGKIVLFRRFALDGAKLPHGFGIDAANWADNTPDNVHGDVRVQDFYEVLDTENIDRKVGYARAHLDRSGREVCPVGRGDLDGRPNKLYVNFLSASNFWKVGCWPDKIAAKVNPAMIRYLCEHDISGEGLKGDGCTGIVVCDWVGDKGDWDLVRCIVGMNAKLELREKRAESKHDR